jgi:RNase H-fold protein (predicted Holliday junction resolvase)
MPAPRSPRVVIAFDPGREKCGWAVVSADGALLAKGVVPEDILEAALARLLTEHSEADVVVGDATGSAAVRRRIEAAAPGAPLATISEHRSTERALARWRETVRPAGWRKLLPTALRFPGEPIDDFAAWILAEDWLSGR